MGQYDIYEFLKENKGKKFSNRDISKQLEKSISSVCVATTKLIGCYPEIKYEVQRGTHNGVNYFWYEEE